MDGAVFPSAIDKNKTPADFMSDEVTGIRPGQTKEPYGTVKADLSNGIEGKTIPPRSVWVTGDWKDVKGDDYTVWVVSGEGTPGNYLTREYDLPMSLCHDTVPKHPSAWTDYMRKHRPLASKGGGKPWQSGTSYGSDSSKSSVSSAPSLPFGLRIRCPGCGHFFKMDDLPTHAKNACPANPDTPTMGGFSMWVIKCECHESLQEAATVLKGFPVKPPDMSGDKKDEKPDEKLDETLVGEAVHAGLTTPEPEEGGEDETGGGSQSESKEGAAA